MMRMQIEFLISAHYPTGLLNFMSSHIWDRGLVIYSVVYLLYIILMRFSPGSKGSILLATVISLFFGTFFLSTFIMIL